MHSSRMRTARLLPVSPRMHCAGKDLLRGGRSAPGGGQPVGGICSWGDLLLEGSASGGVCSGGSAPGGCIPACTEADTPREQND